MGLNTSHDCYNGPYSVFNRWRWKVAEVAGYPMDGNGMPNFGMHPGKGLVGKWDQTPADALIVLLWHSDCDGAIYPEQQLALAARLEELKSKLPTRPDVPFDYPALTQLFIDGLRQANAENQPVIFH